MSDESDVKALEAEIARLHAEPDDCVVKHCDEPATIGTTIVIAGLRIELDLCQEHFDLIERDTP